MLSFRRKINSRKNANNTQTKSNLMWLMVFEMKKKRINFSLQFCFCASRHINASKTKRPNDRMKGKKNTQRPGDET